MKVLITYDFLGLNNLLGKKLVYTLDFIEKLLTSLKITTQIDSGKFNQSNFHKSFNEELDNNKKFYMLDISKLNSNSFSMIKNYTSGYDLLITYELSEVSRNIFDMLGIKYINFWLSPIRFYKDLLFDIYSNDVRINCNLKKYKVDKKKFYKSAEIISDQYDLFSNNLVLEDNSLLLIGQMLEDRSVQKENKFLTLLDFKERIFELSSQYQKIYFQKHPLMNLKDFKIYEKIFQDIENFEYLEQINTYELLSKKEIKKVVAISSSVLYEAQFFNKEIEYLYQPIFDNNSTTIYKDYFKTAFWIELLGISEIIDSEILNYDNYFRYKLDEYWSYKDLLENNFKSSKEIKRINNYNIIVKLFYFIKSLPKNKQYILYGFGSIGQLLYPHIKENIIGVIDQRYTSTNDLGIEYVKLINENDLSEEDNVLITVFKENEKIKEKLNKYNCNLYIFDIQG